MLKTDGVCVRAANKGIRIRCQRMDRETVLIEGTEEGLRFLGRLLIAQAEDQWSCKKQISPHGVGNALFEPLSDIGLYLHRIPCEYGPIIIERKDRDPKKSLKSGELKGKQAL